MPFCCSVISLVLNFNFSLVHGSLIISSWFHDFVSDFNSYHQVKELDLTISEQARPWAATVTVTRWSRKQSRIQKSSAGISGVEQFITFRSLCRTYCGLVSMYYATHGWAGVGGGMFTYLYSLYIHTYLPTLVRTYIHRFIHSMILEWIQKSPPPLPPA